MPWSCPDCRTYANHANFVCPRCHLGALYDARSEEQLQSEGYESVPGADAAAAIQVPQRGGFWRDVLTLSCAGWLMHGVWTLLRWGLTIAAVAMALRMGLRALGSAEISSGLVASVAGIWLTVWCIRRIIRP